MTPSYCDWSMRLAGLRRRRGRRRRKAKPMGWGDPAEGCPCGEHNARNALRASAWQGIGGSMRNNAGMEGTTSPRSWEGGGGDAGGEVLPRHPPPVLPTCRQSQEGRGWSVTPLPPIAEGRSDATPRIRGPQAAKALLGAFLNAQQITGPLTAPV